MTLAAKIRRGLDRLRTKAGVPAVYRRGSDQVEVTAKRGKTVFRLTDDQGNLGIVERSEDFLIRAEELVLTDGPVTPIAGDEILVTEAAEIKIYTVSAPAGEPCYRKADAEGYELRIHTKEFDIEP